MFDYLIFTPRLKLHIINLLFHTAEVKETSHPVRSFVFLCPEYMMTEKECIDLIDPLTSPRAPQSSPILQQSDTNQQIHASKQRSKRKCVAFMTFFTSQQMFDDPFLTFTSAAVSLNFGRAPTV